MPMPDTRRGAGVDEVAGLEHHELAEVADHLEHGEDHRRGRSLSGVVSPLTASVSAESLRVGAPRRASPARGRAG